ncbi:relaxase/mobilization nuclease domain-containing protein [Algirhabdus cladophorae]|uniref:relaxase/mobilization nuclease domain-containing protein n=1 Tax=Algirhabdus cladophorae TaxID=3377108 RepID=UPI003B849D40
MDYYLHDRREPGETEHRTSSDRVEWTSMRNLATDRTDVATAIMISTAKDANRLKQEAGVKATGRKAKTPVKTFALSWHPDEAASLDRAEMERAANEALQAIGMERHQAIIICHNDTCHPHVHVVVNRVNPENGKLAKCGPNENRALDRWAYEYERDRGNIVSPNRAEKHERQDRKKRQYSADERRNHVRRKKSERVGPSARQDHRNRSKELTAKHKKQWADLSIRYQARKGCLRDRWKARIRNERKVYNAANKGLWKQYGRDKWRRKREFDKLDSTFYGRLSLSIQAARLQRASGDRAFKDIGLAKLTWVNLQNARLRNATILGVEKQHLANFKDWYDRPLRRNLDRLSAARAQDHRDLYARFQDERADLITRQKVECGALQSQWRSTERRNDRVVRQETRAAGNGEPRSLQTLRDGMEGRKMNNDVQVTENKSKPVAQISPSQGPSAKMRAEQRDNQIEEKNAKFREANRKQGEQYRNAAKAQLEQRVDAQAKAQSRAAQATQKARKQNAKDKAAAKDRGAAEKRSLQDKSLAHSKAKDALAGLRSPRPSVAKGKTQDRER